MPGVVYATEPSDAAGAVEVRHAVLAAHAVGVFDPRDRRVEAQRAPQALEAAWTLLDYKWMDTAMPLQLVHDEEAHDLPPHAGDAQHVERALQVHLARLAAALSCPRMTSA